MSTSALLTGHNLLVFLAHITVVFLSALLLGRASVKCGLPALVGELTAGVLVGPALWSELPAIGRWIAPSTPVEMSMVDAIGQLGVVLMVGLAGMHLDLGRARKRYRVALKVSMPGLVVPFTLGVGAAYLIPVSMRSDNASPLVFAMFIGVALCVSAVPVIAKMLFDMKLINRNVGQLILMAGSIDDAVGWLLLSLVSAAAVSGFTASGMLNAAVILAVMLIVTMTVGRVAVDLLVRAASRSRDSQIVLLGTVVTTVFVFATISQALHLEAVFGAFLCGILLRRALERSNCQIESLRFFVISILAPFYFATAGMRLDLGSLLNRDAILTAVFVVLVAVVGKFAGVAIGGAMSGMNRWETLAVGAGMNARGVVEIVVATVGLSAGILTSTMYSVIVLLAIVTSVMAPPILRFAMKRVSITEEERIGLLIEVAADADRTHSAAKSKGTP